MKKIIFLSILAVSSPVLGSEFCPIDDEQYLLDEESYRVLQQDNYRIFSREVSPTDALLTSPQGELAIKGELPEALDVFSATALNLTRGPDEALALTSAESLRLLRSMGRTAEKVAAGALEALGPVGDILAVGLWAEDVAETFADESRTAYDRFESIMGLIDVFGLLKVPERDIDRKIIASHWDSIASGEHYSYTLHQDLATQQDHIDKVRWAHFSDGYDKFLQRTTLDFLIDVGLKYQLHYIEAVQGQTQMAQELINGIDQELYKSLMTHLALNEAAERTFSADIQHGCAAESRQLLTLLAQEASGLDNNRPGGAQIDERELNSKLARVQSCQLQKISHLADNLYRMSQGDLAGFSASQTRAFFTQAFDAKQNIIDTAAANLALIRFKLIDEMRQQGHQAIGQLFASGAVAGTQDFILRQGSRSAIDEMVRSLLYRSATASELDSGLIVLAPSYETCVSQGTLFPHTECTTTPAITRQFNVNQDDILSTIRSPQIEEYLAMFDEHLGMLIDAGWNIEYQEHWLQVQATHFLTQQTARPEAERLDAEVRRWLFDRDLGGDCTGGSLKCGGWNSGYLADDGVHRDASLRTIENWLAGYGDNIFGDDNHSSRIYGLKYLVPLAIKARWRSEEWEKYHYFAHPSSVDIQATAPKIYAGLIQARERGATTVEALVASMKVTMKLAMDFAETQEPAWLNEQIGDFHRYAVIAKLQRKTTGHPDPASSTHLFNETLPANLTRFATGDISRDYRARLELSLGMFLTATDPQDWQASYGTNAQTPLRISHVDGRRYQDIDALTLAEQLAAIQVVTQEYIDRTEQGCDVDFAPLQAAFFAMSGNQNLQLLPFLPRFVHELGMGVDSLAFIQAIASSRMAELNLSCERSSNSRSNRNDGI